ncbi:hypothetical protein L208DRAFT_1324794, partial [Tricholoma matsutake]
YKLVFPDEFNTPGRTFYPDDDPYWEAVEDSTTTTQAGLTPGSTAPFQPSDNHNQSYHSGMLQSWNKFCFTSGYIEMDVNLPGPDRNTQGYVHPLSPFP